MVGHFVHGFDVGSQKHAGVNADQRQPVNDETQSRKKGQQRLIFVDVRKVKSLPIRVGVVGKPDTPRQQSRNAKATRGCL